jgi:TonB family protein
MFCRTTVILPVAALIIGCCHASLAQLSSASSPPVAAASSRASSAALASDREQDGLAGPVRRVRTEVAKVSVRDGKSQEGGRVLLETATYDVKGKRIDHAYFLTPSGAVTGKEVYQYDDKGNIVEMTLFKDDGTIASKEVYEYEYDAVGNWTKMTTSVAIIEGGKLAFEPTEVTYRTIAYYFEESIARALQPAAAAPGGTVRPASPSSSKVEPPEEKASHASPARDEPEPRPHAAPPSPPRPISGGVLNGMAIELPKPVYPELAKRARATGTVTVEVMIDETGKVIAAKAVSGNSLLHRAAVDAAYQARFSPTLLSGRPIKVTGVINYSFLAGP